VDALHLAIFDGILYFSFFFSADCVCALAEQEIKFPKLFSDAGHHHQQSYAMQFPANA